MTAEHAAKATYRHISRQLSELDADQHETYLELVRGIGLEYLSNPPDTAKTAKPKKKSTPRRTPPPYGAATPAFRL